MNNNLLNYKKSFRVTSLFFFIQGIIFATWASRIIDIKSAMQLSDATLGAVIFAIPVGQLSFMAISAWAVNRFTSKRVYRVACVLLPGALLLVGMCGSGMFGTSLIPLVIALFFFGGFTNLNNICINTQAVDVERFYNKNVMPTFHGMWSLGGFSGAVISFVLAAMGCSVMTHYLIVVVIAATITSVMNFQLLPSDAAPNEGEKSSKGGFFKKFDRIIILLGLISFAAMICEGTMFDWSNIYFKDVVKAPDNLVRLGYIVCMSTMATGRFIAGWFINRYGNKNVVRASGLLIAFGLALSVAVPNLVCTTIGFLIIGFGISSNVPVCYSIAGRSSSLPPSVALAAVSTIGCFGFLLGPPLIGLISEGIGLRMTFALIILLALCIVWLIGYVKEKTK